MASGDEITDVNSYEENQAYLQNKLDEKINNINNIALRNFEEFLGDQYNYKTAAKVDKTNVIDQDKKRTWALPEDVFAQLMHHIEECRKAGVVLHMSEKQQYTGKMESGMMLDFDCKYKSANPDIKKTTKSKLIEAIIDIVVSTLDHKYIGSDDETNTVVGIIERPKASLIDNEKLYKKGFHVLIPGVCMTRPHKKYIVSEIKKSPRIIQILNEMGMVNPESACDTASATVPVYFIGSCKASGGLKYELTNIYNVTLSPGYIRTQEIPTPTKYNLAYEFSLTHEAKYKDGQVPMIKKRMYRASTELETKINDHYSRTLNGILPESDILDVDNKVNTLLRSSPDALYMQGLLSILSPEYYTDYNKWRDVIFALANSSTSSICYKPLAIWFSQKCPEKFSVETVNDIWEETRVRSTTKGFKGVTIRSIEYWARQCDQIQYFEKTRMNHYHKLLNYAHEFKGCIENSMISDMLFSMLKTKFVVDKDGKQDCWYEFVAADDSQYIEGEVWKWRRENGSPITLQQYITNKLPEVFNQVTQKFIDNRNKCAGDKEKSKYLVNIIKALEKSKLKLFNNIFKERTIKESVNWFINRGFTKKLDVSCPNILGVGNGLLEMGKTVNFINHYHEYPVSKYTVVPWKGKFDPNNPDAFQQKLLDTVADIIIENDARIKLMMFLSTGIVGGVKNLPLLLLTGGGSNGKTVLMTLMIETLGKDVYSSFINPMIYSKQPESADRPNSSLMQLRGKTFTVGEETNKNDALSPAALKAVIKSGGTSSRELFGKQESFQVTATQIVTSQYEFTIPTTDHGTWRRIISYVARTKFCGNPDPGNIFETKDDPKCRDMASDKNYQIAWLQILVYFYEWFQEMYEENFDMIPSSTIDMQTEIFRNSQDRINQFIHKFVVTSPKYATEGQEASLECVALKFLKWHDVHYGSKKQTLSEVVKEFENSAIQKNLRRNKTGALEIYGIRVLDEKEFPRESEIYYKLRNDNYHPHKDKIPFWWKRPDKDVKVTAEAKMSTEIKTPSLGLEHVLGMRSEKSIIAAEHGDDKDFIDVKKKVESPKKDDSEYDLLAELGIK